jgi:exodeoxyribonuclease-3
LDVDQPKRWVDALRTRHPGERIDTDWDYFRHAAERNAGLALDHVLLNPPRRLQRAGVGREVRGCEKTLDAAPRGIALKDRGQTFGAL